MVDGKAPGEDAPQTDSIVLRDLSYRLAGRTIVAPCSLTLALAGRTVILGPNGAGKSTLLQLVHGMLEHSSGSVRVADTRGHFRPLAPDDLGFVMQRPVMLGRSALANVEHALAIRKVPREPRRRLALEALERVGLSGLAERYAPQLSGGEQQRLSIARAVAASPRCLLLDEPTSSLDPGAAASIERLLLSLSAQGLGIVMATHDLGQARRLASDVVFMHGGSVVENGSARAFFSAPGTEPGRRFLAGDLLE